MRERKTKSLITANKESSHEPGEVAIYFNLIFIAVLTMSFNVPKQYMFAETVMPYHAVIHKQRNLFIVCA